jgi:hypothetical protein
MKGRIDAYDQQSVRGWAWDPESPDRPVVLEIKSSDGRSKVFIADGYREDLEQYGIGDGRHGFVVSNKDWELNDGFIVVQTVGRSPVMIGNPMQMSPINMFSQKKWASEFTVMLSNEIVRVHEAVEAQRAVGRALTAGVGQ